jgi:hypothetical protein
MMPPIFKLNLKFNPKNFSTHMHVHMYTGMTRDESTVLLVIISMLSNWPRFSEKFYLCVQCIPNKSTVIVVLEFPQEQAH